MKLVLYCGLAVLAAGLPFFLGGCAEAGIAAYALVGDVPVDAEYELPRVPTLVFVENYVNPDASGDDANVLSRYIAADLKKHLGKPEKKNGKKLPPLKLIDPMDLYNLRMADSTKFHQMEIQQIGRKLGAKQVIYVSMYSMDVQELGAADMMRGSGAARVKVVSSATGQTLWPEESSGGYPVSFESKLITPQQNTTAEQVRDKTMRRMAHEIARLFYKWNPSNEDDDIDF
jgi:hypothetical protein